MEYQEMFKFLNLQIMQRKNAEKLPEDERNYIVLNLLDYNNNPCRFFVFNKKVIEKLLTKTRVGLEEMEITFSVSYIKDNWHVNLVDVNE